MIAAASTWSDSPSPPSAQDRTSSNPPLSSAENWLAAAAIVIAIVFGAASKASQSATVGASVTAGVALSVTLIPWLWAAWLERRFARIGKWRLMAAAIAGLGAAQVASAIVVIDARGGSALPLWIDLLRVAGGFVGVVAAFVHLRSRRVSRVWTLPVSGIAGGAVSAILLAVLWAAATRDLSAAARDWIVAWAVIAAPLTAAVLWWLTFLQGDLDPVIPVLRLAAGWSWLTIVLAGYAADRVLGEPLVIARSGWESVAAAVFLATAALSVLRIRLNGAFWRVNLGTGAVGEPSLGTRNWLMAIVPYVAFALAIALGVTLLVSSRSVGSIVLTVIAFLVAIGILTRQVVVQAANARAARRLEMARLELATQANVDPVTGLPNRRALDDRLAEEIERARRYRQPLSLCFIDLDHFKQVNDDHGHPAGDAALRQVGALLRRTARGIDFVGRFGGEEFVVLVPGTWSGDAAILGERLRRAVADSTLHLTGGRLVHLTISVGIAGLPEHAQDAESLYGCADMALYTAKHAGRNRVILHDPHA